MNYYELLRRQLKGEEGVVLHAYPDHLGYLTIGTGRLIDKKKGGGISMEENDMLLTNDIAEKERELDNALPWWRFLDDARRAVIFGMAFQMGVEGLLGFRGTLDCIKRGDTDEAARRMMQSLWARQTPERAQRMADQMRFGAWQFKRGH